MSIAQLTRLLRLPGTFLLAEEEDVRRVARGTGNALPLPQRIFLEKEEATPGWGYPVLLSDGALALRKAFENYIQAEMRLELDYFARRPVRRTEGTRAWDEYRNYLADATTNAVSSSFGRSFPSILWLFHSIAVSRTFKQLPAAVRRAQAEIGKKHAGEIKYRIFFRYLDRVLEETYDIVQRAATATDEDETELFPSVLSRMRDNVLILTEDHIGPDLRELGDYFTWNLRIDGQEFRRRFTDLGHWHTEELGRDAEFRAQVRSLTPDGEIGNPWSLLVRPNYVAFLARRKSYDSDRLFNPSLVKVWEKLLHRLKEFELLADLRRYVVPIQEDGDQLKCAPGILRGAGSRRHENVLSFSTRPLDFAAPLVVDPLVRRFGLIYDITDFSSIISMLRRSGTMAQDLSFRRIFRFQRRINRIAREHKLQMEKYLGDGALYSGRHPTELVAAAIRMQRYYRWMVEEDFPFNRGLRIALNYGRYRLLPIETGAVHRYEFFGHGIVELTRLISGKTTRELDDMRNFLLTRGYSTADVDDFFAPLNRNAVSAESTRDQRPYTAYIDHSGALVNEGIVVTRAFVEEIKELTLEQTPRLRIRGSTRFVVFQVEDQEGPVRVATRKLGAASLKGLGEVDVIEVVDDEQWDRAELKARAPASLLKLLDQQYARSRAGTTTPA